MDIKIIINAFILIFILHIVILNINQHYVVGKKTEHFSEINNDVKENSMNFLTSNNNNNANDEFKKKLLKYIQQDEQHIPKENEFEKKNLNKVEASNTYLSSNNEPNFGSNVADISKFYKINFDNLNENELKSTSIETLNKIGNDNDTKKEIANVKDFRREPTQTPDVWEYKEELPMNGGKMNGIAGFDLLESQFAMYNPNKLNLQSTSDNNFNTVPHNDLRKPIVYEN